MAKKKASELSTPELAAEAAVMQEQASAAVVAETPAEDPVSDSSKAKIVHAGRPTAVCRCGDKLVRPVKPDNSTWRCLKVWNGNPTEDCQKGIPHDRVLDADQLARLIANKKDRYADAQDIG